MRSFWKAAVIGLGLIAVPTMALPAGAVTGFPVTGYGFDGHAHVIVGAGSDTTFAAQLAISQLYMRSGLAGCGPLHVAGGAGVSANGNLNECVNNDSNDKNLGNYQGDTVAQANAAGSGAGIRSLDGYDGQTGGANPSPTSYQGTANPVPDYGAPTNSCITPTTGPNADFARSSSGPTTSGSNRIVGTCGGTGNELAGLTFWGYARDAITWVAFNNRATILRSLAATGFLTADDLRKMYDCTYTRWSQVPGLSAAPGFVDGPIVPWTMNDASGTRGTGQNFLINQGHANAAWTNMDNAAGGAAGAPCTQYLNGSPNTRGDTSTVANKPLENDIKQLVNNHDPTEHGLGLSTDPENRDNPENWIWWGSFGVFNAFSFTSKVTGLTGPVPTVSAGFLGVNGIIPSPSRVFNDGLPGTPEKGVGPGLGRTLFHVTRKIDADCPHAAAGDNTCAFVANPGPAIAGGAFHDLNVVGGSSGVSGAVREYTRFQCRPDANEQGRDPLNGTSYDTLLSNAINAAGFQTLNSVQLTPGSRCQVKSL